MAKLILTRGIPASGKSTWAKAWVQEDPHNRVRVNRDDLRRMLYGTTETLLTWQQEQNVSAVEKAIAKTALEKGKDVVVDAMNLRAKWVKQWTALGYPVEFKDFEVNLEDALFRNGLRESSIPDEVIAKIFQKFTKDGKLMAPPVEDGAAVEPVGTYQPDWSLPSAWIVDIDGTLAKMVGRSPYDYSRVSEDALHEDVAALVNRLGVEDHIIIVSGREDSCEVDTRDWLIEGNVRHDYLYMRKAGDQRKDSTVKAEIFNEHIRRNFNVLGVLDDRNQVVAQWRAMGLRCYQVAEGNF